MITKIGLLQYKPIDIKHNLILEEKRYFLYLNVIV